MLLMSRQYETGECTRSGFCNFMHLKPISRKLRSELYGRNSRRGNVFSFLPHTSNRHPLQVLILPAVVLEISRTR